MNPGRREKRVWTSADGRQSNEIDVYIPATIVGQTIASEDPIGEAAVERSLQSLRDRPSLLSLAPILLRSEGIASSRIEGEVASTRRVFEAEYAARDVSDGQADRIVNAIRVMSDVIANAGQGMEPQDFDCWHALLFRGTPVMFEPGAMRTRQNWIGGRTDTPVGAEFIPPPPELVKDAVEDLVGFVNRVDVAPLTQAAIAHAQFETIHPYPDGNGRIGRALVYRCWAYRGISATIHPPISRIIVENRASYVNGLAAYREGDVDAWLELFFGIVQSAVSYTQSLGARVERLAEKWLKRLAGTHEDALAGRVVADLSTHPIVSASDVAERYEVTERGARAALDDLAQREILSFRTLRKARRGRPAKAYEATELFELLDLAPHDLA